MAIPKQDKKIKYDAPLTIAIGGSRKEMSWKNREMLWSELVEKLRITCRTPETVQEYQALPKTKRDEAKDVGGFVGGTLKGGRRKIDSVSWRQLLTLDADYVTDDPWPMVELLTGCAAVEYSTHSHTPSNPRLRLVIPLDRPVTADEYAAVSRRVAADIGIDMFDDTTYEPHRLMYWPSTPQDGEYLFKVLDNPWLKVDDILDRYGDWRDPAQWPTSSRKSDALKKQADKQGDPTAKEGIIGAFCRTYSITAAIDEFLADVYSPAGEGRYTFTAGSCVGGLVVYDTDTFAYSHHGTDPTGGRLCNAFDLVRIHKFGDQDEDVKPDTPINRLPSYQAMNKLAREDKVVKQELVTHQLSEAQADFNGTPIGDDTAWMTELELDKRGNVEPTVANMLLILQNDERLKGHFAFDEFRERPVILRNLPWQGKRKRQTDVWSDSDDSGLRLYLEKAYKLTGVTKIADALEVAMMNERIHPVREYLDSLIWDGNERVNTLLVDYIGAEDDAYTQAVTRKALVGAVARIYEPGCKHDHMLVLIGKQGTGKSTLLMRLGGKWFSDSLYTVSGKEAYEQLQGVWIVEMSEMSATRKAEVESVKQFVSKQYDTYRAAYARRTMTHPRQCAFIGTTNDMEFLHDQTGNRRFWPVMIGQQKRKYDLWKDLSPDLIGQIWAEAITLYKAGEDLYLDPGLEKEAVLKQEKHTEGNAKLGLIEEYLETLLPENWNDLDLSERRLYLQGDFLGNQNGTVKRERVCAIEIWQELFIGDSKQFNSQQAREINGLLRQMKGWVEYSGGSGKLRFGGKLGPQKAYIRQT